MANENLIIYTDGSTKPTNPGPGGFGVIVVSEDKIIRTYSKREDYTTNNRQELKAILWAMINYGKHAAAPITVYSDSAYSINSLTTWKNGWKRRGWLKGDNQPPENLDLIQAYDELESLGYKINLQKIKGHAGEKYNELVDQLAREGQI